MSGPVVQMLILMPTLRAGANVPFGGAERVVVDNYEILSVRSFIHSASLN